MTNRSCNLTEYMVLDEAERVAIGIICLLTAPFILLANILVLVVIACSSNLRQHPSYLFMGNLALADTIACCFFTTIFLSFHLLNPDSSSDSFLFQLGGVTVAFTSSVGSLLLMAVDRYHIIYKAFSYNVQLKRRRALVGIATLWVVSVVIAILPLMGWRCATCQSCSKLFPYVDRHYLALWAILVLTVLVLILVAYGVIVWKAHQHDANMDTEHPGKARMRVDIHLAKTFSLILLALLVCWMPVLSFMMVDVMSGISECHKKVFAFCSLLCLVHSGINPLLYTMRCRELRAALAPLLDGLRRWRGWCRSNTSSD